MGYAFALPMEVTAELVSFLNLQFIGNILTNECAKLDPAMASRSLWSWKGSISVALEYISDEFTLAKYKFLYCIISSFVNFINNPYLPFKFM